MKPTISRTFVKPYIVQQSFNKGFLLKKLCAGVPSKGPGTKVRTQSQGVWACSVKEEVALSLLGRQPCSGFPGEGL